MPSRLVFLLACLALIAPASLAQSDAPQMATQQAQRTAQQQAVLAGQQASDQVLRQAQLSSYQYNQAMIQGSPAQMTYENLCCFLTESPKFSVKSGKYSEPRTVKITDSTAGATIYFTTDGWTPTAESQRYTGPIKVSSTTMLRAIAISPRTGRSFVTAAKYTIDPPGTVASSRAPAAARPAAQHATTPGKVVLPQGTTVHLVFASPLTSKTAEVGDKIALTLDQDLVLDGVVAAPKGSPATGRVVQVDKPGFGGMPGQVNFHVDALNVHGTVIKLRRTAAFEGQAKPPSVAVLIPVVGPLALFKRGTDAVIARGTPVDATVDSDTLLVASK
jgi:Chitobiase/beta-hexosaminidase C-terminal domain